MSAWTCRRQGRAKDCSTSFSNPMMEGPSAESVAKRQPASDIDAAVVDSLKALDLNRPIREADIAEYDWDVRFVPKGDILRCSRERRYSITSSASNRIELGTSMPRALAVCKLTRNSNLVDCRTGRSAGFAPLRI